MSQFSLRNNSHLIYIYIHGVSVPCVLFDENNESW